MRRGFLAFLMLVAFGVAVAAADWPQWRGPNRDNVVANCLAYDKWPEKAPAPLWKVEIGEGYSSPVIAEGRLFIMGREGEKETCLCFHPHTGKEIWKHAYDAPYKPHPAAKSAGLGPKSTPCIDDDRVYFLGITGWFHCLEAKSGKELWKHDFQTEYWGVEKDEDGYDMWPTYCGASSSPVVDRQNVIVSVGGKKAGSLAAFDRDTGKLVWKGLEDRASYASPIVTELAGVKQIVGFTGTRMVGLDPKDGKLLWEFPVKVAYEQTIVSPVLRGDQLVVCAEENPTRLLRFAKKDGKLEYELEWSEKKLKCYMATPTIAQDHLFGLDSSGQLVCIDMETGKTAWSKGNFGQHVSILNLGKRVAVLSENGEFTVIEANPNEFKAIAKLKVSEAGETWANPALINGRLYVKDKKNLFCLDFLGK